MITQPCRFGDTRRRQPACCVEALSVSRGMTGKHPTLAVWSVTTALQCPLVGSGPLPPRAAQGSERPRMLEPRRGCAAIDP